MKHDIFLRRYISFLLAAFMLMYTSSAYMPVNGEEAIYSKILRLHVIANSDSDYDQDMKLAVRDAVLAELACLYSENGVSSLREAKKAVDDNRERLVSAAKKAVFDYGGAYDVTLELGRELYPTKSYDNVTLPAGEYESLKIRIGNAEGKNWWCVLFPTLCLVQASRDESADTYVYEENGEKFIAAGFTPEEIRIITEAESDEIKVKFRFLEIFGSLFAQTD
ncbi:MAG: stage II sporulation protein R [Clostridia bacterium]|nr:stage II sporulation protein R [Clostridia bacterium]